MIWPFEKNLFKQAASDSGSLEPLLPAMKSWSPWPAWCWLLGCTCAWGTGAGWSRTGPEVCRLFWNPWLEPDRWKVEWLEQEEKLWDCQQRRLQIQAPDRPAKGWSERWARHGGSRCRGWLPTERKKPEKCSIQFHWPIALRVIKRNEFKTFNESNLRLLFNS